MNINKLMKQAQKMQETIAALEVEGNAGGGVVKATMTGTKHLVAIKLDPGAIDPEDPALLEDLILAAVNDAERKVEGEIAGKMGGALPGMPGLF
ncbi:MAG: YbaB/EbfC family nucleoid-associated protein [Acidobacteriota bacterium]